MEIEQYVTIRELCYNQFMLDKISLDDLRKDATYDRDHVGAVGCIARTRASTIIELIDAYEKLKNDYRELEDENAFLQGRIIDMR